MLDRVIDLYDHPPEASAVVHDDSLLHFQVLSNELHRLGSQLSVVTPQEIQLVLAPHEHLVQCWFNDAGQLCVLWLTQRSPLRYYGLDDTFNAAAWDSCIASWHHALESPEDTQARWTASTQPQAVMPRFLAWCWSIIQADHPQTGVAPQLILLPSAKLACLPWLAMVSSSQGSLPTVTGWQAGQLVLAVSTTTLLAQRTLDSDPTNPIKPIEQVAVSGAEDCLRLVFGKAEALNALAMISDTPRIVRAEAKDIRPLTCRFPLQLLQRWVNNDRMHLIMHGHFEPIKPGQSLLAIETKAPTTKLTVWQLSMSQMAGEISMSVCQAMSIGEAKEQYYGPLGIGAALVSAGATCVIGCLWQANQFASMVFYYLWFEERPRHTALQTLAICQGRMRTMDAQELEAIIQKTAPHLKSSASGHIAMANAQGWPSMFSPPYYWAGYTVLADAPMHSRSSAPMSLWMRCQAWLRAIGRILWRRKH